MEQQLVAAWSRRKQSGRDRRSRRCCRLAAGAEKATQISCKQGLGEQEWSFWLAAGTEASSCWQGPGEWENSFWLAARTQLRQALGQWLKETQSSNLWRDTEQGCYTKRVPGLGLGAVGGTGFPLSPQATRGSGYTLRKRIRRVTAQGKGPHYWDRLSRKMWSGNWVQEWWSNRKARLTADSSRDKDWAHRGLQRSRPTEGSMMSPAGLSKDWAWRGLQKDRVSREEALEIWPHTWAGTI